MYGMQRTARVSLRMPIDLIAELRAEAAREGISVAALILRRLGREQRPQGRPRREASAPGRPGSEH